MQKFKKPAVHADGCTCERCYLEYCEEHGIKKERKYEPIKH